MPKPRTRVQALTALEIFGEEAVIAAVELRAFEVVVRIKGPKGVTYIGWVDSEREMKWNAQKTT